MIESTIFTPFHLNKIILKNRIIKSATYEGLSKKHLPTEELTEWHKRIIQGGVAMTTLAYCAVNPNGATFKDQIILDEKAAPQLKDFTSAMHSEGGLASVQLAHCGFFKKDKLSGQKLLSPSVSMNKLGFFSGAPYSKSMSLEDIDQTIEDFSNAALLAKNVGFDAVEIHCGHGYLISQFLSPKFNKRKDAYGGNLVNRLKFPVEVIQGVRLAVGPDFPILLKMNLSDGYDGGLQLKEARHVASTLEKAGVDAIVLSGGVTSVNPFYLLRGPVPFKQMIQVERNWFQKLGIITFGKMIIKELPFSELYFLESAKEIRKTIKIPLIYVGGVASLKNMEDVITEGFELLALGRPLIHDSEFINRLQAGEIKKTGCTYCNQCIAEIDRKGVRCVL